MEKKKIKYIDVTDMEDYACDTKYDFYDEGYKEEFNIDDCFLVRTTDIFPIDKVIQTPRHANAYEFGSSSIFKEYLSAKIREKYPPFSEQISAELREYNICFETLRSTIHFSLNGVVGSHAHGDFSNRPFVIIEPLKYHLDKPLITLAPADTFFDDDILLSNECILLIDENFFNIYQDNPEFIEQLSNFNVCIFKGDASVATKQILEELNKYYFSVGAHGYVNGLCSNLHAQKMHQFIINYAKEHNISTQPHSYSQIGQDDSQERNDKGAIIDKEHLDYVLEQTNTADELKEKFYYALELNQNEREKLLNEACDELISRIGLDKLKQLTKEFNKEYIMKLGTSTKFRSKN